MEPQPKKSVPFRRQMRKGVYLLPNLFTASSTFCGFFSIIATINGDYVKAAWAILIALIFDGLDGRVARATHTESEFGMQFDSLSDLVSFGIAPALLAYSWALLPFDRLGWFAAFTFLLCGALRLARFNVNQEITSSRFFEGLPIPAAAAVVATFVLFYFQMDGPGSADLLSKPLGKFFRFKALTDAVTGEKISILIGFYVLASLMISTTPYYSFKKMSFLKKHPFFTVFLVLFLLNFLHFEPQITLFTGFSLYVLSGPIVWLARVLGRSGGKKENQPDTHDEDAEAPTDENITKLSG